MSGLEIAGATALVTGASRGFGRGIATALSQAGAQVTGVARDPGPLAELHAELGGSFTAVARTAQTSPEGKLTARSFHITSRAWASAPATAETSRRARSASQRASVSSGGVRLPRSA